MKLDTLNKYLGFKLSNAINKVEHEVAILNFVRADKKKAKQKLIEVIAENKKLEEKNAKLEEEAKQKELKNKELEKKLSEFESGSTFN